ncbi:MAG: hypothetical protein HZB13_13040 [Acidobacteria bacterium]|nr:hypothetical protein [Acidobacteriota bacterium]
MVSSELAVAGFTENPAAAPAGKPVADSVTGLAKPFDGATVTVVDVPLPCTTVPATGDIDSAKSGVGAAPHEFKA